MAKTQDQILEEIRAKGDNYAWQTRVIQLLEQIEENTRKV